MVFVVDESCDYAVVLALRIQGFEVVAISEVAPRAEDEAVLKRAVGINAVLITEDHDFGQLVHAAGKASTGVILLRYRPALRAHIAESMGVLARQEGTKLKGRFVVVEPGRIRMSPLPPRRIVRRRARHSRKQ